MGIRWGQPNPPKAGLGLGWGSLLGGYLMSTPSPWFSGHSTAWAVQNNLYPMAEVDEMNEEAYIKE